MVDAILGTAVAVYALVSILLFAFGANLMLFSLLQWRTRLRMTPPALPISAPGLPTVTVQVPIYNEWFVAERVVRAVAALEYPRELLEIQVLDDSTDETWKELDGLIAALASDGIPIQHVRRADRRGFKAGALADGGQSATGELTAVFDADFVPPTDFLLRTVGEFTDPTVAFVQARWGHLNRSFSLVTRLQSLAIDSHFLVEQSGRRELGCWFNFNGTCGVWRSAAIEDAGGWRADTLTEDLDLSYRAHLAGWRGVYREDIEVPGELPAQMSGFRRQQHRWARGSIECAARLLGRVWRAPTSWSVRIQSTAHLCAYGIHLLLLTLLLVYPLVILAADRYVWVSTLFGLGYVLAIASLAPITFLVTGQKRRGEGWVRQLPDVMAVTVLGSGLMVNTARAAIEILTKPNPEFERTPKFGLSHDRSRRWSPTRYHLGFDRIVFVEILLGCYCFATAALALQRASVGVAFYSALFGAGLVSVAVLTMTQELVRIRSAPAVPSSPGDRGAMAESA